MIMHYNHGFLFRIHNIDALICYEKHFFPPISFELLFIHQMRKTLIFKVISIIFVINHYNNIFFIGIHGINALFWQDKLFLPPFSIESKFICQTRWTLILITIYNLFVIKHYDQDFLIGIPDTDALVWQKKLFFHHFPWIKVHPLNMANLDSHKNLHSSCDRAL